MFIGRTPIVYKRDKVLRRGDTPKRTPLVGDVVAQYVSNLVVARRPSSRDLDASLRLAEVNPTSDVSLWESAGKSLHAASLAFFFADVISGPNKPPYNGHSLVGTHHEAWDAVVADHDRILIEAARDHGKSHFFSLGYVIWKAGIDEPSSLGYLFSSTQDTASALLGIVRNELLTNPKLEWLLPPTRDLLWSKKEITLGNGSVIRARGFGVKVRGGHPSWIVVDDALTDEDIYSATVRRRSIDYYLSAIVNMIEPGGQIIVVGTPMHYADLYGHIEETGSYHVGKYPAINADGEILFPERYDAKRLEARKVEVGPARFAREFLCRPLTDDASLFPSTLFAGEARVPYRLGLPAEHWKERGMVVYTGVDIAMSASAGADYTVIFTIALDKQGVRWVVDIVRVKGMGFQGQIDLIKDAYAMYQPEVIYIEANQMQRIFSDEIVRTTILPVRKFFTSGVQPRQPWRQGMTSITAGKHNIDRGVPSLRMSLENGKWRIPRGDARSVEITDIWIGEMGAMGWVNGQVSSVGEHDDTVMACWIADQAARLGAFSFSFGDDREEGDVERLREAETVDQMENETYPTPQETSVETEDEEIAGGGIPTVADLGFGDGFGF